MPYVKTAAWRMLLSLLLCLSVIGCATKPQPQPPVVVKDSVIPPLSPELKKAPEPSGAYWSRVMQLRKDWRETLKTLPPKSAP